MPQTYETIATYTATANVSTFTFSSIPSTYTDLIISANLKNNTGAGYNLFMRFNGDTSSNYSTTELWGNGSAAGSSRTTNAVYAQLMRNDNSNFSGSAVSIQNYSNATTYKIAISKTSSTNNPSIFASTWRSTAAINSITFLQESPANIVAGSTLTLYGVKSA